jgi:hypothetical protein
MTLFFCAWHGSESEQKEANREQSKTEKPPTSKRFGGFLMARPAEFESTIF